MEFGISPGCSTITFTIISSIEPTGVIGEKMEFGITFVTTKAMTTVLSSKITSQVALMSGILDLRMCNQSNGISITRSDRVMEYRLRSNRISLLRGNRLSRTEDISYPLPVTYHIPIYWNTIFEIVSITI